VASQQLGKGVERCVLFLVHSIVNNSYTNLV
jgi:hypothetical protein